MSRSTLLLAAAFAACFSLSGCGGKEFVYQPDHELKPGPGLFSGEDGEFTLIGTPEKQRQERNKQKQQE